MSRFWKLWPILLALALLALTPYPPTMSKGVTPQWAPVPGNPQVEYAPNLKVDLFRCGGRYYYWVAGGWQEGTGPTGPWRPAAQVPPALRNLDPALFKSLLKPKAPRP